MLARLHVIISSKNENDENHIKQLLMNMNDNFSISPSRPYALLKNHNEFFITFQIAENEIESLLLQLNNDWDGEQESCHCYGFNTKMFHPLVYCLEFDIFH